MMSMRYTVVYEKSRNGWGSYPPDLPGCGATGRTLPLVRRRIREAIKAHIQGLREDGYLYHRLARWPMWSKLMMRRNPVEDCDDLLVSVRESREALRRIATERLSVSSRRVDHRVGPHRRRASGTSGSLRL